MPENQGKDVGATLKNVGMVVLNSVGGAMGALYGTVFLRLAQESAGKPEVDLGDLVRMFQAAEKGLRDIGKAQVGDKTLMDAFVPAVSALEEAERAGKPLARGPFGFRAGRLHRYGIDQRSGGQDWPGQSVRRTDTRPPGCGRGVVLLYAAILRPGRKWAAVGSCDMLE